jgi:hypothetical protein
MKARRRVLVGPPMSLLVVALGLTSTLAAPAEAPRTVKDDDPIEVVVETKKKPDWLFPGLDHPRVQAFFNSGSSVGGSLLDESGEPEIRPLVRTGTIKIHDAASAAERRAARRFARALVDSVRPALEACYVDALDRSPTEAARLTFRVELSPDDRGPVLVSDGMLGDVFGNACVHGVLEFAEATPPRLQASLEIPVWFWLQTVYAPS